MKTLYLDIFSGISGDMFLAALVDLGVDPARLEKELRKLPLAGYHLHVSRRHRSGIEGVKFDVHLDERRMAAGKGRAARRRGAAHGHDHDDPHGHDDDHGHSHPESRDFSEIKRLIGRSKLSAWVKKKAISVFERIAAAEGAIHGVSPERVHFHEVGAIDSIVDIVGGCIGLELLGKPSVLSAPVIEGTGWVDCDHGRFPVPAPATLAILGARGIGLTQCDEPHELVTPTGAALLAEFAESFGPMRGLSAEKIGFGLGTRENKSRPNVLRAVLGRAAKAPVSHAGARHAAQGGLGDAADWESDTIAVLETNLDDVSSEVLGNFMEKAIAAGALDVFHTPVQMKKSRPGVLLSVLCDPVDADKFSELMLVETSAFGVRRTIAERRKLRREFVKVNTRFGPVTVKVGTLRGRTVQAAPEFESCRKLADRAKVPLKKVYEEAVCNWRKAR